MNQVVVFYNPFLPELKISVNGKKLSPYSSLMSFQHQRLEKWSDCLFSELYREVNSDYEMFCVSNEFTCEWLEELANRNAHCISFVSVLDFVYHNIDSVDEPQETKAHINKSEERKQYCDVCKCCERSN